jgi:hypothetical protein
MVLLSKSLKVEKIIGALTTMTGPTGSLNELTATLGSVWVDRCGVGVFCRHFIVDIGHPFS